MNKELKQLKDILNEQLTSELASNFMFTDVPKKVLSEHNIIAELVDEHGGEGQGDEYYSVYKFTLGEESVLVMFEGTYASYYGAEYEQWGYVVPKEVMHTIYVGE